MKKSFFQFPKNMSSQSRNAFLFASVLGIAHFVAVPYYLYVGNVTNTSQFFVLAGISSLLGLLFGIGAILSWRERPIPGVILALTSMAALYPPFATLAIGLGIVLGIAMMIVGTMIALQVLPQRLSRLMAGIVAVSGILTVVLDVLGATTRPTLPGIFIQILAVGVIGLVGFFIVREFPRLRTNVSYKLISVVVIVLIITAGFQTVFSNWATRQNLENEAQDTLLSYNLTYETKLRTESLAAEALAVSIASRSDVQELYQSQDRDGLYALLEPMFTELKEREIVHLYIENPEGTVFLRIHDPEKFGDDITYRGTAKTALHEKRVTSGVEIGANRLGVRGVAPMYASNGQFLGLVEVGIDFDEQFIADLKETTGADYAMWVLNDAAKAPNLKPKEGVPAAPIEEMFYYTSSNAKPLLVHSAVYRSVLETGKPAFQIVTENTEIPTVVYITPLLGYQDKVIGLLQISESYAEHLNAQKSAFLTTLGVTAGLTILGLFLISLFSSRVVIQPLNLLAEFATQQMRGDVNSRVTVTSQDEFQQLAATFNSLAESVEQERLTLEKRVAERTHNLEVAAEVGRTVSQVRSLDILLTDAAELIREQFGLYYVQVYLLNPSQTYLNLQAGTGQVGAQLLERKHRLPFSNNSINGRAAVEKKSVVISSTAASSFFMPNPLLPDTRSEMAVPLLIGDRVVGVLDMQSEQSGSLNRDILPAFEALAGQLAIAIQNANFLAETEQARAEVEAQAKRVSRSNWAEYLDAIHKPEETGFVFEQNQVVPLARQTEVTEDALVAPITVTGEELGNLVVEIEGQSPFAQTDELLNTVARQVSQQIENLRLLDSAERYRRDAEEASRRLTREGWKSYIEKAEDNLSYVYDLKEVRPQNDSGDMEAATTGYALPLKVRDETVGKLVVQGLEESDAESVSLANEVSERLGAHIESLRLYTETQSTLAQSEKLFETSRRLTQSADLQELVSATVTSLDVAEVNRALLTTFDYDENGEVKQLNVIANWWNGTGHESTPIGTRYPLEVIRVMPMFISPVPVFFSDTFTDKRVDATTMELVKRLNLRSVAVLPLHLGSRQIGALVLEAEAPHNFTQEEIRLFSALAPQIATITENQRQFEHAQKQAERESKLNVISQKIQSATTVEAVLQIAARELGHTLGAPLTIAQLGLKETASGN